VALDEMAIIPDSAVCGVVGDLAQIIDSDNEYCRVVTEHEALHGLLDQMGEARAEADD
jgi:hypothetical protein